MLIVVRKAAVIFLRARDDAMTAHKQGKHARATLFCFVGCRILAGVDRKIGNRTQDWILTHLFICTRATEHLARQLGRGLKGDTVCIIHDKAFQRPLLAFLRLPILFVQGVLKIRSLFVCFLALQSGNERKTF